MIHIICALKPEAIPVVDYFDLKLEKTTGHLKVYHNDNTGISLTISGVGKAASASAVQFTYDYFTNTETDAWINLGIAGHLDLPIGQAVLIKKISDAATQQTWYPSIIMDTVLPVHELLTLEKPGKDYKRELFDMEGAGFFQSARRLTALELIQLIKVISDNAEQTMDEITPDHISHLMQRNLTTIHEVIGQLTWLSGKLGRIPSTHNQFDRLTAQRHFTVYQQQQLRSLLKKWHILYPDETDLQEKLSAMDSGKSVIDYLLQALENAPVYITHRDK